MATSDTATVCPTQVGMIRCHFMLCLSRFNLSHASGNDLDGTAILVEPRAYSMSKD
mgnify:CR=1 FL=1